MEIPGAACGTPVVFESRRVCVAEHQQDQAGPGSWETAQRSKVLTEQGLISLHKDKYFQ